MPLPTIPSGNVASATASTGYDVDNSLRFHSDDSSSLSDSYSSNGNQKTWTWSAWIKRAKLGSSMFLFESYASGAHHSHIYISSGNALGVYTANGNVSWSSSNLLRDITSWYHICVAADTTQGSSTDRLKMYINNKEVSYASYGTIGQNNNFEFNGNGSTAYIGRRNAGDYFDGYMAEVCWVDGTALTPSSFGEYDSKSPQIWKPKDLSDITFNSPHSYYMEFKNSSALGTDSSGQSNTFTANNLAAIDQSVDTPSNNFAVCNSLDNYSTGGTFKDCNLQTQSTTGNRGIFTATYGLSSGVWYWEIKTSATGGTNSSDQWNYIGIAGQVGAVNTDNILGNSGTNSRKSHEYALQAVDGSLYTNGASGATYAASFTEGDILGFKLDLDNNRMYVSKNGQWADGSGNFDESNPTGYISISAPSTTESGFYFPAWGDGGVNVNKTWQLNFGGTQSFTVSSANQDPNGYGNFEYDTKSGYAICSKNIGEFGG